MPVLLRRSLALAAAALLAFTAPVSPVAAAPQPATATLAEPTIYEGVIDGARFRVTVPARWNGELFLWSRGHFPPGTPNVPVVSDYPLVEQLLLGEGYAFAASAYRSTGWAVEDGLRDQVALLDWIKANIRRPKKVYAWGQSMGGLTSILLAERNPGRFAGVLSLCGPNAGAVAFWNQFLDMGFALRTLIDPTLELTSIADPVANRDRAVASLLAAFRTPEGRARIALSNALTDVPAWFGGPRPTTLDEELLHEAVYTIAVFQDNTWGITRAEVEQRAGGNPSWNVGVDYRRLLARSTMRPLVERAYAAAGLSLEADLAALDAAPRIAPDLPAVGYLARYGIPIGTTWAPVVTLHNTEDGLTGAEQLGWYGDQVARFGDPANLRQLYIDRAHHCRWSSGELMAAVRTLLERVHTGRWPGTSPAVLNAAAATYGPEYQRMLDYFLGQVITVTPAYVDLDPTPLLRPFPF